MEGRLGKAIVVGGNGIANEWRWGNVGQMEGLWYLKLGNGSMYGGQTGVGRGRTPVPC